MGDCFVVSYIIRTFDLSMDKSETGSRQHSLAEGGLPPALYCSMGESIRQVGVYLLLIFQSSRPLLKTMNPIGCRLRYNPQTNTLNYK